MPYWLRSFSTEPDGSVTASQDSLIVSILSAGTFFGALTAAPFGDLLGRRWGLMASAGLVFNLGVILQTAATRQPLFIAGRFFAGYGVGLVSALSESPIPSIAPPKLVRRGPIDPQWRRERVACSSEALSIG
jgi:SP family sugar:H+ symporter-like MFS transporter